MSLFVTHGTVGSAFLGFAACLPLRPILNVAHGPYRPSVSVPVAAAQLHHSSRSYIVQHFNHGNGGRADRTDIGAVSRNGCFPYSASEAKRRICRFRTFTATALLNCGVRMEEFIIELLDNFAKFFGPS